ncbi:hypothetical protein Anas_14579 [Armadillidium nasatum]|uniref:Uncharacterized protein n=1 Tax=Armadillidium nasatum TaxID=96803 RepID=A0A5N5T2H7_9CRUS|nr:hypothetical protein Anas_14579 [Armadillidium nasatum]
MGKKRDRSALATPVATDSFLLDETRSLHVSGTEDEDPPGKKSKKHKKKKSSKKEKQNQGSDHSLNEGKSVEEIAKEINDDENIFCDSDGTRLTHKTSDGSTEKRVDDELKRMKNPRLMTARQRALMEKRSDGADETFAGIPAEPLLALPSAKVVTPILVITRISSLN